MSAPTVIEAIKAKPGRYFVSAVPAFGFWAQIEVDETGTIHQLTPNGKRDGVLSDDGWTEDVTVVEAPQ